MNCMWGHNSHGTYLPHGGMFWLFLIAGAAVLLSVLYLRWQKRRQLRCPGCGGEVENVYLRCPDCGLSLKSHCPHCQHIVQNSWKFCPHCKDALHPR